MDLSPTWRTLAFISTIAWGLATCLPARADEVDLGVTPITSSNVAEGMSLTNVQLCSFTDADDPSATPASFTALINWGDGTITSGTIVANGSGGFLVTGSHTYADELTGNIVTTTITQNNETGNKIAENTFNVVEAETLTGLTFATSPGTAFGGNVASFTDLNLGNTASDFAALIDWGDGTESSATIVSNGSGNFLIEGAHTYAGPGVFTVTSDLKLDGFGDDSVISMADVGRVTSAPEPSSALLLGTGFGLLMVMVRSRLAERSA
jgi:hypothetical protein